MPIVRARFTAPSPPWPLGRQVLKGQAFQAAHLIAGRAIPVRAARFAARHVPGGRVDLDGGVVVHGERVAGPGNSSVVPTTSWIALTSCSIVRTLANSMLNASSALVVPGTTRASWTAWACLYRLSMGI